MQIHIPEKILFIQNIPGKHIAFFVFIFSLKIRQMTRIKEKKKKKSDCGHSKAQRVVPAAWRHPGSISCGTSTLFYSPCSHSYIQRAKVLFLHKSPERRSIHRQENPFKIRLFPLRSSFLHLPLNCVTAIVFSLKKTIHFCNNGAWRRVYYCFYCHLF